MLSIGFVVVAVLVAGSSAFPNGAEVPRNLLMDTMCTTGNFRPHHTVRGQLVMPMTDRPRFSLVVEPSQNPYGPNTTFRVTLKGDTPRNRFKGFFITADAEDAKMGLSGSFSPAPRQNAKPTQFCTKGITHTEGSPKQSVTIIYKAPAEFTHGKIQFKATVVVDKAHFYTGVLSRPTPAQQNVDTQSKFNMKKFQSGGGFGGLMGGGAMGDLMKNVMSSFSQGGMGNMGGMPGMGALANMGRGMAGGFPQMRG